MDPYEIWMMTVWIHMDSVSIRCWSQFDAPNAPHSILPSTQLNSVRLETH